MQPKYIQLLNQRIEKGSERSLLSFDGMIDFWSNDYLGLGKNASTISVKSDSQCGHVKACASSFNQTPPQA